MQLSALSSVRKPLLASAVVALLSLAAAPCFAQPDPPAQAGRLSYISGAVSIQPAGIDDWGQAYPNLPLGPGDRIVTDFDGRAEIQVGQTFVRIGPNADVTLVDSNPWGLYFGAAQGSIHVRTNGLWQGQAVYINTPSGSSTLSAPGELRVDVMPDQYAALFTSFGSNLYITGAGGFAQYIGSGQALELVGSNPVIPQWLQPADWDDLDNWSHQRDQQIAQAMSYRYVSPEVPGAYELDANGSWTAGTPYGPIWFPNNVPYGWAPYHYGHWVNHSPWGWVWVEDESWGYAPFHYGRWVSFNGRWGWIPGPPSAHPIWSPALVVFAGGIQVGGMSVSAWFPLGPGEPYRPWYPCTPRYMDQVNITNIVEAPQVHVQTTYVNINVVNVTYVNRTIGVAAVSNADFASGRSVHQANVVVDVHQMDHVRPLSAPEPRPTAQSFVGHSPARPVKVSVARPVLINEKGKSVSATPGAKPVEPPVKPAPPVKELPGHKTIAPPPGASRTASQNRTPPATAKPDAMPAPTPVKPTPTPAEKSAPPAPPRTEVKPNTAPPPKAPAETTAKPATAPSAANKDVKPGAKPPAKTDKDKKDDKKPE